MNDHLKKPKASFAPLYCGMYPDLAELVKEHGYALSVHGSLQRDFDLFCIPWTEDASHPDDVVEAITEKFALKKVGEPDVTWHGRRRYTVVVSYSTCYFDLQFMPIDSELQRLRDSVQKTHQALAARHTIAQAEDAHKEREAKYETREVVDAKGGLHYVKEPITQAMTKKQLFRELFDQINRYVANPPTASYMKLLLNEIEKLTYPEPTPSLSPININGAIVEWLRSTAAKFLLPEPPVLDWSLSKKPIMACEPGTAEYTFHVKFRADGQPKESV